MERGATITDYIVTRCANALHRIPAGNGRPFVYDLNPYRGCEHRCQYCFAQYSHGYLEDEDYFEHIYVKENIAERLDRELFRRSWNGGPVNLGGITDSYQPCEARFQLMPDIWRVLIKHRTPCIISTKSSLILRDYDLVERLAAMTFVNVACTVTTLDADIAGRIEPRAARPANRLEVLQAFARTKATIGLHMMPIIPHLTGGKENIERLHQAAKEAGADYVLPGLLNLRGKTRDVFFACVAREFPDRYKAVFAACKTGWVDQDYQKAVFAKIRQAQAAHQINGDYMIFWRRWQADRGQQLSLF